MKNIFTSCTSLITVNILCGTFLYAQTNFPIQAPPDENGYIRCGQVEYENYLRSKDPDFDKKRAEMEKVIQEGVAKIEQARLPNGQAKLNGTVQPFVQYTIPIVFHVVYNTAAQNISDAKITAAIAQLNQDWSRTNSDAGNTPGAFLSLAANMEIQFCLATKDPSGNPTNGIVRKQTSTTSFSSNGAVQSSSSGGDDPWDVNKYLNIWSCNFTGGLLGYGMFPPISNSYGTAVGYCTVGSLSSPGCGGAYGLGRTLSHEIGHCFTLAHIWGDDGGSCSGTDNVADTPNQGDATSGCYSFPHTDGCTTTGNGIMYMNFMDYSADACYNMFTTGQKTRCQSAISNYLMSIANNAATVCGPGVAIDAGVNAIVSPNGIACNTTFTPVVKLQNYGTATLTSCTINYHIDSNPNQTFSWTGSLTTGQSANVTLPAMSTSAGSHTFTSSTSSPNSSTDGNASNDQSSVSFSIAGAAQNPPVVEGIENATFPPANWTLSNSDNATTWTRTTTAFKTGSASMFMDNYDYNASGQVDALTTPPINLQWYTNPTLTFQLAYQLYTDPATSPNFSDTLKVEVSTDCGVTWSNVYNKFGTALTTTTPAFSTTEFVPTASDWRLETVSLTPYAAPSLLIKFRHSSDYENNLYVDDINITGTGNNGMDELTMNSMVSVFPNPSNGSVFVGVNGFEMGNVSVRIYNVLGETVSQISDRIASPKTLKCDVSNELNGVYFVEVKSDKGTSVKKFVLDK